MNPQNPQIPEYRTHNRFYPRPPSQVPQRPEFDMPESYLEASKQIDQLNSHIDQLHAHIASLNGHIEGVYNEHDAGKAQRIGNAETVRLAVLSEKERWQQKLHKFIKHAYTIPDGSSVHPPATLKNMFRSYAKSYLGVNIEEHPDKPANITFD